MLFHFSQSSELVRKQKSDTFFFAFLNLEWQPIIQHALGSVNPTFHVVQHIQLIIETLLQGITRAASTQCLRLPPLSLLQQAHRR